MYCIGVTHHNPAQVLSFLGKNKFISSRSEVAFVARAMQLGTKPRKKVVFLLDSISISRNIKLLVSPPYEDVLVFLFASTLKLGEIKGCELLDSVRGDDPMSQASTPVPLRVRRLRAAMRRPVTVTREPVDYLQCMVDHVKKGSLLNPLMTFVYTLPSSTHQTPVKEACARYLLKTQPFDVLLRHLERDVGITLSRLAQQRLQTILESDAAIKYKGFFKHYRKSMTDTEIEALCVKHATSAYEVRYLLSVCDEVACAKRNRTKARR